MKRGAQGQPHEAARARGQLRETARAWGARVEAYGIARVRGRAVPLAAPPRRAVSRRAVPLAAPPRPPRCSSRYRGAFTRPARYRGAFTRPARWHGASARSRPAQRAITPQQWSQRAISPQQWSQRAICRHGLHGQPPPLSFVALRTLICVEGAPGSRSSQPQAAPWHAGARFVALGALMCVMRHMPVLRCRQAANT